MLLLPLSKSVFSLSIRRTSTDIHLHIEPHTAISSGEEEILAERRRSLLIPSLSPFWGFFTFTIYHRRTLSVSACLVFFSHMQKSYSRFSVLSAFHVTTVWRYLSPCILSATLDAQIFTSISMGSLSLHEAQMFLTPSSSSYFCIPLHVCPPRRQTCQ